MIIVRPLLLASALAKGGGFNALNRTTLGRLGAHQETPITDVSTAFNTGDWTAAAGITVATSSGRLRLLSGSTNIFARHARYTTLGARADAMLQYLATARTAGATMGGSLRVSSDNDPPNDYVLSSFPTGFTGDLGIFDVTDGIVDASSVTGSQNLSMQQRVTISVQGGYTPKAYFHGPAIEHELAGGTGQTTGHAALYYSSGSSNNLDYGGFWLMASRFLTVLGPAGDGWKAELRDAGSGLLATATASGGIAAVDVFTARVIFPNAVTLQIRDLSDTLLLSAAPAERLWGGDVWSIT